MNIIERELLPARHDSAACFTWSHTEIRRWRLRLYLHRPQPPWPPDWQPLWSGTAPLILPDGGQLHLESTDHETVPGFPHPLRVRARRGGERLILPGRTHSHPSNTSCKTSASPWRRASMPLLCDGEQILAVGDALLAAPLVTWLQAHRLKLRWQYHNNTCI